MLGIGWRNLLRDPLRMTVAIFGIAFAVVLVTMEVGMLLGLVQNASLLIDRSGAEIWVSTLNVKTFDFATPISARNSYLLKSVRGVEAVEEFIVSYSIWRLPQGGNANVQVIGFDLLGRLAPRIELQSGVLGDLENRDAVIIDEGDCAKLGGVRVGDWVELAGQRAQIVGLTRGMRSFTTTPYIFTSLRRALKYGALIAQAQVGPQPRQNAVYFLVKVAPGHPPSEVCGRIEREVQGVEAHTREGFSLRTRKYWLLELGVGVGFLIAAFLGAGVGGAIVSQTLYAMTTERIAEFAQLKALGASSLEVSRVVLEQSAVCGILGLAAGLALSAGAGHAANAAGTAVLIPGVLVAGVILLTLALCAGASLFSIARLRNLPPAAVFRV